MPQRVRIGRIEEAEERVQVAHLLYEGDKPFIPITPLAILRQSSTFFKAQLNDDRRIRAASSYELWLHGCDDEHAAGPEVAVYELASSVVHHPLGGFREPSLQQIFAFVRLLDMLYPYIRANDASSLCVIAAIAATNDRSFAGMTALGMKQIEELPRWMAYEHRSWFPRLEHGKARRVEEEARYLWLPPDMARSIFEKLAPYADGEKSLKRKDRNSGPIEECELEIGITPARDVVEEHGSLAAAIDQFPFHRLRRPPEYALIEGRTF